MSGAPRLSVVVARSGPVSVVAELASRLERPGVELILVGVDVGPGGPGAGVLHVEAPPEATVPQLRARGLAAAGAGRVALTESFCVPSPGWLEAALGPLPAPATGGPVVRTTGTAVDHALTLAEHGRSWGRPRGRAASPSGANVVYDRGVLDRVLGERPEEWIETEVHRRLRDGGVDLGWEPELVMEDRSHLPFDVALSGQLAHGRLFGASRARDWGTARRALVALGMPLLPTLALARIVRGAVRGGRTRALARGVLPLFPLLAAWAAGEGLGTLAGPGDSLGRWR